MASEGFTASVSQWSPATKTAEQMQPLSEPYTMVALSAPTERTDFEKNMLCDETSSREWS